MRKCRPNVGYNCISIDKINDNVNEINNVIAKEGMTLYADSNDI